MITSSFHTLVEYCMPGLYRIQGFGPVLFRVCYIAQGYRFASGFVPGLCRRPVVAKTLSKLRRRNLKMHFISTVNPTVHTNPLELSKTYLFERDKDTGWIIYVLFLEPKTNGVWTATSLLETSRKLLRDLINSFLPFALIGETNFINLSVVYRI